MILNLYLHYYLLFLHDSFNNITNFVFQQTIPIDFDTIFDRFWRNRSRFTILFLHDDFNYFTIFFPADITDWFWSNFSIRFDTNRCIIINQNSFFHSFIHAQFILSQLLFLNLLLLFIISYNKILRWKNI